MAQRLVVGPRLAPGTSSRSQSSCVDRGALREKLAKKLPQASTAGACPANGLHRGFCWSFLLEARARKASWSEWQSLLTNPAPKAAAASPDLKLLVRQGPRC